MDDSRERFDALIRSGARRLTGYQRRLFQAEVALELCGGSPRLAERRFGWGRETVETGLHELRSGIRCRENFAAKGRKRSEEKDPQLADPHTLPSRVQLDANQELQCTTCHDAHNNVFGDFLVMNNLESALCTTCHKISHNTVPSHNNCITCHSTHTAPSGPYLLKQPRITSTCTSCHDGTHPGASNILSELTRLSVHDTDSPVDPPEPIPPDMPAMFVPLQELENLAPGTWYVNVLAVLPEHRGRGLGRRLLELADAVAREAGCRELSIIVSDANARAIRLYERVGYRRRDERPMVKEGWPGPGRNWRLLVKGA